MKTITINSKTHGVHTVLVDDEDFDLVSQYEWSIAKDKGGKTYAITTSKTPDGKRSTISMHRLILNKVGGIIRHKDLDGLNNTRGNLEEVVKKARERKGERFSTYRRSQKQIETQCATCGTTMFMTPSYFSASEVVCCSRACYAARIKTEGLFAGDRSGTWKGGVTFTQDGRKLVKMPDHPHANVQGYVYNYRLVMEKMIGRYLTPEEVVHHKDEDPTNDDPSNLVLCANNAEHRRLYHNGEFGHTSYKLSAAERAELRMRVLAGETQTALAKEFNVSQPLVSQVKRQAQPMATAAD